MNATERRERLRRALAGDKLIYPAPIYDPISARLADMVGFEIGFMAPTVPAAAELCAPSDIGVLTPIEFAQQVRRISRVSDISLLVVAENGYGNALNAMRTVEELENAGVAGVIIYDLVQPLSYGTPAEEVGFGTGRPISQERLVSIDEAVGKLKAVLEARQDPSLVIVGRTMALHLRENPIPETVMRVKAYEAAGVDAIFVSGLTQMNQVEAVHAATKLPILTGRHLPETLDQSELAAKGIRMASAGHLTLWASVRGVYDTLKAFREGKTQSDLRPSIASPELMAELTRQEEYGDWIEEYLN